jgi:prophage regulatory protein
MNVQTHPGRASAGELPTLIRIDAVLALTRLSKSTIYKLEREGHFPRRTMLTHRASAWFEDEVHQWLRDRRDNRDLPPDQPSRR